jgi:hypothetical protein
VNGDHLLDMVVASQHFLVLLNQGAGVFGAPSAYPVSGYLAGIATGDLDGDGRVDIVGVGNVSGGSDGFVAVLLNGPSGFGAAVSYGMTQLPASILVTDFDGDRRLDIVAASQNDDLGVVSVFLNTGNGTFGPRLDYSSPPWYTGDRGPRPRWGWTNGCRRDRRLQRRLRNVRALRQLPVTRSHRPRCKPGNPRRLRRTRPGHGDLNALHAGWDGGDGEARLPGRFV